MNLQKLFNMQRTLDARIVKEHGLEGQDLLPQKILALQVELGECANEWRGFKFWSKNLNPNTNKTVADIGRFDKTGETTYTTTNPLLEEYIDCLHFILSIGITLNYVLTNKPARMFSTETVTDAFGDMFWRISDLDANYVHYKKVSEADYESLFGCFVWLGEMLGFTEEQIEEAYMNKNKVNHERQDTNY